MAANIGLQHWPSTLAFNIGLQHWPSTLATNKDQHPSGSLLQRTMRFCLLAL